jgi:hypothetical protein
MLLSPVAEAVPAVFVAVPHAAGVKVNVVLANVNPAGNVSGNCTVVTAPGFAAGFVTVRLNTLVPPEAIVDGVKLFVTVGGVYTLIPADADVPLGAFALVTAPVVLVFVPATTANTCTVYVQVVDAGTTPPVNDRLLPLAAAVNVPVQPTGLAAAAGVPLLVITAGVVG